MPFTPSVITDQHRRAPDLSYSSFRQFMAEWQAKHPVSLCPYVPFPDADEVDTYPESQFRAAPYHGWPL